MPSDNSSNSECDPCMGWISSCFGLNQGFNHTSNWSMPMKDSFCSESRLQIGCAFLSGRFFKFFKMVLSYGKLSTNSLLIPEEAGGLDFLSRRTHFLIDYRLQRGSFSVLKSSKACRNSTYLTMRSKKMQRTSSVGCCSSFLMYFLQCTVDMAFTASMSKG